MSSLSSEQNFLEAPKENSHRSHPRLPTLFLLGYVIDRMAKPKITTDLEVSPKHYLKIPFVVDCWRELEVVMGNPELPGVNF